VSLHVCNSATLNCKIVLLHLKLALNSYKHLETVKAVRHEGNVMLYLYNLHRVQKENHGDKHNENSWNRLTTGNRLKVTKIQQEILYSQ